MWVVISIQNAGTLGDMNTHLKYPSVMSDQSRILICDEKYLSNNCYSLTWDIHLGHQSRIWCPPGTSTYNIDTYVGYPRGI